MDREPEELQFLGMLGIFRESYKINISWHKILTKINLALVLPLSFILLAQILISEFIFDNIINTAHSLDRAGKHSSLHDRLVDRITSEWVSLVLFKAAYFLFLLILSLLSTSAIVYTVACIYTSKELSFKKVLSVVPKVWKRLMVTFLWNFVILAAYNFVAALVLFLVLVGIGSEYVAIPILIIISILYIAGFVYINVVWHLASVVSVLEDVYGIQAMIKSKKLIQGKMWTASAIFLTIHLLMVAVQIGFQTLVVDGESMGSVSRALLGILFVMLLSMLIHLGLVIQTVVYFVCKSYHHENIDKSCLADHLEVYLLGEYVPLKGKDVQLESFYA